MTRKTIHASSSLLGLTMILALTAGLAQESTQREQAGLKAIVSSKFSFQGVLNINGAPVSGPQDFDFQLFSDNACSTLAGDVIPMPGVQVTGGLFNVELTIPHSSFQGQGLWLGIEVGGSSVGCQEILPVPYALSLRPGALIEGDRQNWDGIHVVNEAEAGQSYGVYAQTMASSGRGVYGYASSGSGETHGVYGRSNSSSGSGVYARGLDAGADLILGANSSSTVGDDGRVISDPAYASSDILLITNDTLRIDLDEDGDGEDADFEIRDKDNTLLFNVDESGSVTYGGTGIAAFPRPAYNSGWVAISQGGSTVRTHSLGANTDNYVVDLTCKRSGGGGVNNWGVGGDANSTEFYGAWWSNLTTSGITLHRWDDDTDCPSVRVRIWMYS